MLSTSTDKTSTYYTFQFSNPTSQMAFFLHPKITNEGEEIFPAYWSANYFTLAPKESITLTVSLSNADIAHKKLTLQCSGWNRDEWIMDIK